MVNKLQINLIFLEKKKLAVNNDKVYFTPEICYDILNEIFGSSDTKIVNHCMQ